MRQRNLAGAMFPIDLASSLDPVPPVHQGVCLGLSTPRSWGTVCCVVSTREILQFSLLVAGPHQSPLGFRRLGIALFSSTSRRHCLCSPSATGESELNDIWRKIIKSQALSLKLTSKTKEEIQKKLKERF